VHQKERRGREDFDERRVLVDGLQVALREVVVAGRDHERLVGRHALLADDDE
jgi:hypothetical protein